MRTILILILVLLLCVIAGCGGSDSGSDADISVTATTTQTADFVREIAGGRVDVTQILSANADPHEYEPKPSDAESLTDADLVVQSGGDLDAWLDQIVDASGNDAPVLTLIDSIETRTEDNGETDPHWWQDPENAEVAVGAIRDELIDIDPDGAQTYRANAAAYIAELKKLDAAIASCIDKVPVDERKLVTSHDALGYYADRYGIDVIGAAIPSLSTQAQASAGETADLVDLIRRTGVSTIFPEAGVSKQLEQSIADEAGASVGGELWADTLGPDGSDGVTYIDAEEANTEKLVEGFTDGRQRCMIDIAER